MSRSFPDLPERLLDGDATDFERRILKAGAQKLPSPELQARMARAIGVSATAVGVAGVATKLATDAAATKAAAGSSALLPWISMGVLGLVVAGAVVGTRAWKASPAESGRAPAAVAAKAAITPSPSAPSPSVAVMPAPPSGEAAPSRRSRASTSVSDLQDQIAVIDLARSAVTARDGRRALETLRRYQDKYPLGHFRPEVAALKIEALVGLGRDAEARVLAERFIAEHNGSMLADRVAEIAGISRP